MTTKLTQKKPRQNSMTKIWEDFQSIFNGARNPKTLMMPVTWADQLAVVEIVTTEGEDPGQETEVDEETAEETIDEVTEVDQEIAMIGIDVPVGIGLDLTRETAEMDEEIEGIEMTVTGETIGIVLIVLEMIGTEMTGDKVTAMREEVTDMRDEITSIGIGDQEGEMTAEMLLVIDLIQKVGRMIGISHMIKMVTVTVAQKDQEAYQDQEMEHLTATMPEPTNVNHLR